ncbi:MAG TPA: regulatory iron-sulfur-containing complex subunit RicT, partial [Phycisphaerae bacterium]|nr:regulatory iron-sulfur-containing complex subunit RicT [Phycisphaerae bacterium]
MTDSVDLPNNGQSAPFENDTQQTQPPAELRENSTESQPAPQTESQPVASFAQNAFENSTEVSTDANSEEKQLPRISEAQTRESQIQPEESAAELAEEDFQLNEADENLLDETYTESVQDFQENNSEGYELQNNVAPEGNTIVVRYGVMQFVGEFRHNLAVVPTIGSKVVVRTERGVELGEVLMPVFRTEDGCGSCVRKITGEHLQKYLSKCGPEHPFRRQGKVLRTANQQDIIDFRHLSLSADEAAKFCRENIARFKLNMKLVKVEHLLGGGRIIFYFTAEQRVDFRELVKTLAGQFRTRIEMRQVGARDEARLVGDYERCGQRCCCQQFLKNLKPVSMKMAKVQKATLDPSKISGRCGRLMCCLRYEDEGYEELRKRLPRRGIWVRLEDGAIGKVVDTQILTQLVKIELPNREFEAVNVDEIAE